MVRRGLIRPMTLPQAMAVGLLACTAGSVRAQVEWHGSLGVTSDYVQSGLSQTRGKPALQAGLRADVDQRWSIGVWSSQIDRTRGPGATYEIDAFVARAWPLSPDWSATLTATHYFYPNDTAYLRYDYDELTATVAYRARLSATVAWSPNTSDVGRSWVAEREQTWAYELAFSQPMLRSWSCSAGIGRRDMSALFGEAYWYGHAGISYTAGPMSVHLTYMQSDHTARHYFGYERAANTLVGGVIWRIGEAD